jgi:uncharacterized membrane protein
MARATRERGTDETLVGSLRGSPATKRLSEQARHLLDAQTGRLAGKVGEGVSSATEKLTHVGETGQLPALGEGAKRMLQGDSPVKSALAAAKTSVTDKTKELVGGAKGGGKGTDRAKAINIEESIDIGVPVSVAYDQWTQFKDFSRFTKGVESVEQVNETETNWRAKVFKSRRTWKAKIQEQIPDRRIVWTSTGSKGSTKGVVTFHPLADDLTRVLVALEYYPSGVVEKTGNIWRAAGRRTRLDLKNFRRFVMLEGEPTGSWRGEIHEGKVVKQPEESDSSERRSGNGRSSGGGGSTRSGSQPRKARKATSASRRAEGASDSAPRKASSGRSGTGGSEAKARPRKSAAKSTPRMSASESRPRKATAASSSPRKATTESRRPRKAVSERTGGSRTTASSGRSSGGGSSGGGTAGRARPGSSTGRSGTSRAAKTTAKKQPATRRRSGT